MTEDEFARAFPSESELVERKRGAGGKALQEAVTAFSNGDGGVVLIGVDDDGGVAGREPTTRRCCRGCTGTRPTNRPPSSGSTRR